MDRPEQYYFYSTLFVRSLSISLCAWLEEQCYVTGTREAVAVVLQSRNRVVTSRAVVGQQLA